MSQTVSFQIPNPDSAEVKIFSYKVKIVHPIIDFDAFNFTFDLTMRKIGGWD